MVKATKLTQSEKDGVQYRRAKTWQIALGQLNNGSAMIFYSLVGLASYLANAGYGIAVAVVGLILTGSRVLDGVINPFLAVIIDRFNPRFGKLRFFMLLGWAIRSLAVMLLFVWAADAGLGAPFFILVYAIYIVGTSINDIAGNMVSPVMSNDPRQRPAIGVWGTIYAYLFPTVFGLISTIVILPKYHNHYSVPMLRETALLYVGASLVVQVLAVIGVAQADRPESFRHLTASADDKVSLRDMLAFLKSNKPFQRFVVAGASEKIAQVVASQAVISTMLFGILIGNIQLGTLFSMGAMLPSIAFAIWGARYAGKHGARKATVTWSWASLALSVASIVFGLVVDMRAILGSIVLIIVFFGVQLALNGSRMCVTTAAGAMRADIVDYELDRSGKYLPGMVTAAYNFIDQLVSSLGAAIALGAVALIGYTTVMPQPTDSPTRGILYMTLFLVFGLQGLGWIATIVAMRGYQLTKPEMVAVQKRIAVRKHALAPVSAEVVPAVLAES